MRLGDQLGLPLGQLGLAVVERRGPQIDRIVAQVENLGVDGGVGGGRGPVAVALDGVDRGEGLVDDSLGLDSFGLDRSAQGVELGPLRGEIDGLGTDPGRFRLGVAHRGLHAGEVGLETCVGPLGLVDLGPGALEQLLRRSQPPVGGLHHLGPLPVQRGRDAVRGGLPDLPADVLHGGGDVDAPFPGID